MKKIFVLFFAFFALFFSACGGEDPGVLSLNEPFKTGEKITLKSVSNTSITLLRKDNGFVIDGSDKIIMFDIFGTFCAPCQKEAAHLMDYQLKNSEDFMLIGLITFENITDKEVIEKFIKPFNAYYFIANDKQNERLIAQILADIEYKNALSLPFKVVLKDAKYQLLSDNLGERGGKKSLFYLGEVKSTLIAQDIEQIKAK